MEHGDLMSPTRVVPEDIRLRDAGPGDLPAVARLLAVANLVPIDGTAQFGPQYGVAEGPGGDIIGVAGYERYGADILLRSVAVAEEWRSAGIGAALTADRLAHARNTGCSTAYLLTDTAQLYWLRHGFEAIERSAAPVEIKQSTEWGHACPQSAVAMRRRLTQSG